MGRAPRHLMKDRIDAYTATIDRTTGAKTYAVAFEQVPCMVQPATSEVMLDYGRHNETVSHSIFLLDGSAFSGIGLEDRIVADSLNFVVKGRQDLSGLGRVYRIDVIEESK